MNEELTKEELLLSLGMILGYATAAIEKIKSGRISEAVEPLDNSIKEGMRVYKKLSITKHKVKNEG